MMKMRHVSVFRVKPEHRNPETIQMLADQLRALPQAVETIIDCEIGVKPFPMPTESPDGHLKFYDLIQIITFASPEDCAAYPAHQGHLDFRDGSSQYMAEVIGIDYPL